MHRLRMLTVLAAVLALGLWTDAGAESPRSGTTLEAAVSCVGAPWQCGSGPDVLKWLLYRYDCDASNKCAWKYIMPWTDGAKQSLLSREHYRVFLGVEDDPNKTIEKCSAKHDPITNYIQLDFYGACNTRPAICQGPNRWQVYVCEPQLDGSCVWGYYFPIDKDCSKYDFNLVEGRNIKLHWGQPRDLELTPTATRTPEPTETPYPSNTPSPTRTSTPEPTAADTATPLPPTATATAVSEDVFLPMLSKGATTD